MTIHRGLFNGGAVGVLSGCDADTRGRPQGSQAMTIHRGLFNGGAVGVLSGCDADSLSR
jgi:hypothetical protein